MAGDLNRETLVHTGIATAALGAARGPRSWALRVVSGADAGRTVSFGARAIVVGADAACDLVLTGDAVSRRHAELRGTPRGVQIKDLGSTNGTHWQGARVTEVLVPSDATIKFGDTTVRIEPAAAPVIEPSSRRGFGGLLGESPAMREIFAILELASPTDATVLVEGESGTGKELVARAVHDHSSRADKELVVVDCSATVDTLVDSQLFGHVKGAFTGAAADRQGAFVAAHGGTIFLDEIGELPLGSQAKLLRVLEQGTIQPVGSDEPVKVDVRVVAATHRDLAARVDEGSFRFDLYHRLAVVHLKMPPLRERPEDIAALVCGFYAGRDIEPGAIDGDNLAALQRHGWPGNVRELRNVLERAWVLSGSVPFAELKLWLIGQAGTAVRADAGEADTSLSFKEAKDRLTETFERSYLAKVFEEHGYNLTHAAEHAGLSRRHMRELLQKHGISKP